MSSWLAHSGRDRRLRACLVVSALLHLLGLLGLQQVMRGPKGEDEVVVHVRLSLPPVFEPWLPPPLPAEEGGDRSGLGQGPEPATTWPGIPAWLTGQPSTASLSEEKSEGPIGYPGLIGTGGDLPTGGGLRPGTRPGYSWGSAQVMPSATTGTLLGRGRGGSGKVGPPMEPTDLLRLSDLAEANRHHAAVLIDPTSRRDLVGYINLTRLCVSGAGSGTDVDALAGALSGIGLHARVGPNRYDYFLSERLLLDPILCLRQGAGLWVPPGQFTRFSTEEYRLLRRYLRGGGFLVIRRFNPARPPIPPDRYFLWEMVDALRTALGPESRLVPLPISHPVYHAWYDFDSGFPEEDKLSTNQEVPLPPWYFAPVMGDTATPLPPVRDEGYRRMTERRARDASVWSETWGLEWAGELVALINPPPVSIAEVDANIGVYALTRPGGSTAKLERLAWQVYKPLLPVGATGSEPAAAPSSEGEAADLAEDLDASLAVLTEPDGTALGAGGLRVAIDGRYSVEILNPELHGLLLHNLPAGAHWLELRHDGRSRQIQVDLAGGMVTTVRYRQNRFAFLAGLDLRVEKETLTPEGWAAASSGLRLEELFLAEDRQILE